MRLVHTADCHLGFRAYARTTATGLNQREVDVARQFHAMIDRWIELRPDLVCIAGDLFDKSHPSNPAIVHAMNELARFRRAVPDAIVVIAAGNHDQARTTDAGSILPLFQQQLGIHVAARAAKRLRFADRELSVLLVPDGAKAALEPDPAYRYNVLVLHGGLEDVTPIAARGGRDRLTAEDLHADRWSYAALGDYHCRLDFGPNCGYSGSLEYTSSNIWGELLQGPKGFLEFDLVTGERTFHALPPVRQVFDLPVIEAASLDPERVSSAIAERAATIPIDGAIVRQVVKDCPVHVTRELDGRVLGALRARCMHYQLDPRRPVRQRVQLPSLEEMIAEKVRPIAQRLSLEETLAARLRESTTYQAEELDAFVGKGLDYLREASAAESLKVIPEPVTPERSEAA